MKAFFTGSHVYGNPNYMSDLDMVLSVTEEEAELIRRISGVEEGEPVRFGDLNLILCETEEWFSAWLEGTKNLLARKPVSRAEAVAEFKAIFKERGLRGQPYV